ncbi:lustrin A [Fusarium phyllophilum]|uniref:Lustrin A n=1 Tax=Fusarium phyllophilum TaxID=47803 RepID=A0A8H5KC20_9HYPO|nr:lustrin A [Fusarium phyllophilum]
MKSVVASIGMLAAVANAYNFPHHAHYRRDNGTDTQTTLTVKTTVVETITSCAPTITNCPARDHTAIAQLPESDKVTYVETNTVILTEVVCPVADASSIYTSVLHDAETGGVTGKTLTAPYTASVPLTTGGAYPPPKEGDKTVVSDYTTEQVVTLTQGDETITTTVHKTLQTTITVPAGPQVTDDGSKGNGTPEDDTTTTTTKTKTGTVTKTIERVGETNPASGGDNGYSTGKSEEEGSKGTGNGSNNGGSGSGNGNGNGECVPETVTVTAPASTVYVTVVPEASKTGSSDDATVTDKAVHGDDSEDDDDEDDDDEEEFCDTTTTLEATVTVVPYPVNNTATGGYAKPTGFSRRLR